ncbi:MAG: phosphatidate cytidylyltransferase [Bacteroidetes bacterium]|nr:MAG: phosphatidate cytidylyltransferase [Bacteroidota bacterium]
MNNFMQRTLSGALYVIIVIGSLLLGLKYFIPVFAIVTGVALWEFYKNSLPDAPNLRLLGLLCGIFLYLVVAYSILQEGALLRYLPYLFLLPYFLLLLGLFQPKEDNFKNAGLILLGLFYIVFPMMLLPGIEKLQLKGSGWSQLLGVFILFWVNDTGAYLSGRAFGKHPLFPQVSPKKTWEGLIGGVVLCLAAAWAYSLKSLSLDLKTWLVTGAIIAVFGTLGDLTESMWKRKIGIKDSGNIMPGHGGLMDRFDGFFIAIPVLYMYLVFLR